jgi:tetratricopeptide (TPR) repeat protein
MASHESPEKSRLTKEHSSLVEKLLSNAEFYFGQKSYDQAIRAYREILRVDPENQQAIAGLKRTERANAARPGKTAAPSASPPSQATHFFDFLFKRKAAFVFLVLGLILISAFIWAQLAKENQDFAGEQIEPVPPQTLLATKGQVEDARIQAQNAQAPIYATDIFESARQIEKAANAAFAAGQFVLAESLFFNAQKSFQKAREKATTAFYVIEKNIAAAQQQAAGARERALMNQADRTKSFQIAERQFENAGMQAEQSNHDAALSAYASAEKLFITAIADAARLKIETATLQSLVAETDAAAENAAKAHQMAEPAKVRDFAPEAFGHAENLEKEGQQYLAAEKYAEAISAFQEAASSYERALFEKKAIENATRLHQNGDYEQSLEVLKSVFYDATYSGKNRKALDLVKIVEQDQNFRQGILVRVQGKSVAGELKTALALLETLPERDKKTPLIKSLATKVLAMDTTRPEIFFTPPETYDPKLPLSVKVTVRDNISVQSVKLYFLAKGADEFETVQMEATEAGNYEYSISADDHLRREISCYLSAKDQNGNVRVLGSKENPIKIKTTQVARQYR